MASESRVAPLNPEGYSLESAFQAIDRYTAAQNGEPQMMTFGDSISHYAWVDRGKQRAAYPRRKPMFIGSYESFERMAIDLGAQAETDFKLDPYKQRVLKMLEGAFGDSGGEPLPLTTSQESELESFELGCLSLDEIRETARERAGQQRGSGTAPELTIVNSKTGESRTITLDVASLIADGSLQLERRRAQRDGSNDVTIETDVLFGKFLADTAAGLGLDADNVAVIEPRRRKPALYSARSIFDDSARSIFGYGRSVSNDNWTEDGEYSAADADLSSVAAPPRHSLSEALNYRRVDSYDAADFLDAAQDVIETQLESIHRLAGKTLVLQRLDSFEVSFDGLLQSMRGYKLGISELGYYAYTGQGSISPFFFRSFLTAFRRSGTIDRTLSPAKQESARIGLEQAIREAERLRTPALIRAGKLAVQKFQRH